MSPRNLHHNKLSMEEKGKAVTIETDEEEEDLQALIATAKEEEDVEEDIQSLRSATKLLEYVPPQKGKTKIPKDLDAMKSALQTPLLPNEIRFDGPPLGRVPNTKFEDWDVTDSKKFPQLAAGKLLQQEWLQSVDKAGLLHLRWISH